jgi:uncharacterized protein (TIGR03437 family)
MSFSLCFLAMPFLAQGQTTCTAATLSGTYYFTLSGRDVSGSSVISKTFQSLGTITFDGVSGVTATITANTNAVFGVSETLSGTYTIPTTCIGTINFTTGDIASFTLIPHDSGLEFYIAGEDATYLFSGTGGQQPPAACITSLLSGVYAFNGNGFALVSNAITAVNYVSGLLTFDGAGAITGSWATATNGSSVSDTVSGTYTLGAGCTGTATVKDPNGISYSLAYTMTNTTGIDFSFLAASATDIFSGSAHSTFTNPGLSVGNAASFVTAGAPAGSLFSIFGTDLSTNDGQDVTTNLPYSLANASVTVNGEAVPLSYVSPTQINAQMPLDVAPGYATVIVTNSKVVSNAAAVYIPATAVPGIFIYGSNRAVAQNLPSYALNTTSAPAPAGSSIVVYFTGGGPVQGGSSLVTGHPTPSGLYPVTESSSVTVGGLPATIEFIGLSPGFVGLYQANIVIPTIAAGTHNLIITIGGTASATTSISTN